jgi:ferrous iron transport protein B
VSSPRRRIAVAGNPNVGKTSLFNALTGERHKVGNYPGVTVEIRRGTLSGHPDVELLDLPGTYSLTPMAEDEAVAYRGLAGRDGPPPDAILLVLDASNLARNLYLLTQVRELGIPVHVALNMVDVARRAGVDVDAQELARRVGLVVVETVARTGDGVARLAQVLAGPRTELPADCAPVPDRADALEQALARLEGVADRARARWLVTTAAADQQEFMAASPAEAQALAALSPELLDRACEQLVRARYDRVERWLAGLSADRDRCELAPSMESSTRIDRILTHGFFGPVVFVATMALVFQSMFTWAQPVMDLIEAGMGWVAERVADALGPGVFTDLLTQGVVAGVGNVLVFVPQIALLFLFIGLLEDSGYMARAAFLIDRLMARVGLSGKSFVPLLSGYACAIPAILGARTIASRRDRLVTTLMIPFMSCSARLPIYTLVIGALFETDRPVAGVFTLGGTILLAMYGLSTVSALAMGAVYKRTILRGPTPPLLLELPPYRLPRVRNTLLHVRDRTLDFVRDAGTIILACTVVLWALLSFPRPEPGTLGADRTPIEASVGGRVGKALEPALEPIGQDWRIGIGLIGSFAAREVLVSTLGLVYGIESADEDDAPLRERIREARDPATGAPLHTPLGGIALMVFFVYACQCMSTLAVVRRETRSWRWPAFMFVSMTSLAYVMALLTYQGGRLLGLG